MSEPQVKVKDLNDDLIQKPVMLFGRDIRKIKCFRDSFIFGICFGMVGGLATFLFTSKIPLSTNVAFGTLWLGVFGYWFPCRLKYETELLKMEAVKAALRNNPYLENSTEDSS